jgi:hypothetical protein
MTGNPELLSAREANPPASLSTTVFVISAHNASMQVTSSTPAAVAKLTTGVTPFSASDVIESTAATGVATVLTEVPVAQSPTEHTATFTVVKGSKLA